MIDGLSMAAHQLQLSCARLFLRLADRVGVELSQAKIQPRKLRHAGLGGIHGGQNGLSHWFRIVEVVMAQEIKMQVIALAAKPHQGHVHAIGRSSTHHSGDDQTLISFAGCRRSSITSPPTMREKSFTSHFSLSTTFVLGSAGKPRNSAERFLKLSTRWAACPTWAANRLSRSAVRSTASNPRHT